MNLNDTARLRCSSLMNHGDTALVIIDVQEKLISHIEDHQRIVWNIGRLIEGATLLGLPMCATEQYPQGLGGTTETVRSKLVGAGYEMFPSKTMFSCRECTEAFADLADRGVRKLLLTGIETHVCVAQTAFDFMAAGFSVYVCVDAVGSRFALDHHSAMSVD